MKIRTGWWVWMAVAAAVGCGGNDGPPPEPDPNASIVGTYNERYNCVEEGVCVDDQVEAMVVITQGRIRLSPAWETSSRSSGIVISPQPRSRS